MKVVEVKHPLVKHKIGLMREGDISTKRFRELAKEVGSLLTYEATSDFETEKVTIDGWNGPVDGWCARAHAECPRQRGRHLP